VKTYVFDTHTFVWYVQGRHLAKAAARVLRDIDAGRSHAWIPAIVPIELSLLRECARCTIGVPELEATMARNPEIQLLPLDLAQAREFALLAGVRDPFDRLVIAAARAVRSPLLTADDAIAATGLVPVIWD